MGNVAVYVLDINPPSLLNPFYFVLVSLFVFMALSTVFYSIILLAAILCFLTLVSPSYFCLYGPSKYTSKIESMSSPDIIRSG